MTPAPAGSRATVRQILNALAALAPTPPTATRLHVPDEDLVVVPLKFTKVLNGQASFVFDVDGVGVGPRRSLVEPLLKRARLHREENLLRFGWLWVRAVDDAGAHIQFPIVSMPVRPSRAMNLLDAVTRGGNDAPRTTSIVPAGDVELTDLIVDPEQRLSLEATLTFGGGALDGQNERWVSQGFLDLLPGLRQWSERAATAAGLGRVPVMARPSRDLAALGSRSQVVAQLALYLAAPTIRSATIAGTLRDWPNRDLEDTALAALYDLGDASERASDGNEPVVSPLVLTGAQRRALADARRERVSAISGPPGSGKSQALAAIALDTVARNQSVLIAVPTSAAVDALVELLERTPGPDPMVFGGEDGRRRTADRLANGGGPGVRDDEVAEARHRFEAACRNHASSIASVRELLQAELLADRADPGLVFHHRATAPRWFDPAAAHAEAARLLAACRDRPRLFGGFRQRRHVRRLMTHAGASTDDLDRLDAALEFALAARASSELSANGGLDLAALWPRVAEAEDVRRSTMATWLDLSERSEGRLDRQSRATMGLVATALRAGRTVRREKLADVDGSQLTRALPLWIGTLRDIDELLPRTTAMFDLVIVDEGTQVDQVSAATALLRGTRCVVAGDPRQLRHVSFVSDESIESALAANHITDPTVAGRLDIRRTSLFDLAAATVPVRILDRHFRSAPHLISFSAQRFYQGAVTIATTHPRNDANDCISVVRVEGAQEGDVSPSEIEAVIRIISERLETARSTGRNTSIGVISPFRSQADAIEAAIVREFTLEEIDELDLRVGTVHGFQGCERDLTVLSLSLQVSSSPNRRAFVADPNLFNVMVTRARQQTIVVTSLGLDAPGLVGDYLRYGDAPPEAPRASAVDARIRSLADDLRATGVPAFAGYPAGPHVVDLVVGSGDEALGVHFGVHPSGVDAHIERQLELRDVGWTLREAFDTRWAGRWAELAVELASERRASHD